jgi:hypothetical protein
VEEIHALLSEEGEEAMIKALPDKYPMILNRHDMERLVRLLGEAALKELYSDEDEDDFALSLYSAVAATLGVTLV